MSGKSQQVGTETKPLAEIHAWLASQGMSAAKLAQCANAKTTVREYRDWVHTLPKRDTVKAKT